MKLAVSKKNLWEKIPAPGKSIIGGVLAKIPVEYLIGKRYRATINFLEESQDWDKTKIRDYQVQQLHRILTLAFNKTKFYKESFSKHGFDPKNFNSLEQIQQLPLTDRETIKNNLQSMCTVSVNAPHVDYITTGGTSGAPLCFYTTSKRSQIEYAYLVSGWKRVGYKLGAPVAVLRGKVIKKNSQGQYYEIDPVFNHHYFSSFHLTDENMAFYLERIKNLGPCFLHVYPSSIYYLARFLKRSGLQPPKNIQGILAESENVYPEQRQLVEELFNCRYFSSYGHTEKLIAAAECEHSDDYHVWPTYGFFELLDEDGSVITTPGRRGEIVGTGFINDVVPFIRYRTGDFATYVGDQCPKCGRNHLLIRDIRGHNVQETLIAKDGTVIPWSAVNMHDDTFNNVHRFQFYQDTPGKAVLRVIPTPAFTPLDAEKIKKNLGIKFAGRLEFDIKLVPDIPLSGSGKSIFVDQRIKGFKSGRTT